MDPVAHPLHYFEDAEAFAGIEELVALWTEHPHRVRIFGIEKRDRDRVLLMAPEPPYSIGAFCRAAERAKVTVEERIGWSIARTLDVADAIATLGTMHGEVDSSTIGFEVDGRIMLLPPMPKRATNHAVTGQSSPRRGGLRWLSPEAVMGHARDGRSDVYQLAFLARCFLGGPDPYSGCRTEMDILVAKSDKTRAPIPRLRPLGMDIPAALDEALSRALADEPAARFASVAEFADALAPFARDGETVGLRISTLARANAPDRKHHANVGYFRTVVERPCPKRWDELSATDEENVRHCHECKLAVTRVRSMAALLPLAGSCVFYDPNDI